MNSRNFIISVAVAISFFAACFAWETRSALPENEGKNLSVGACMGYCAQEYSDFKCREFASQVCREHHEYGEYVFDCTSHHSEPIPGFPISCESNVSSSGCTQRGGMVADTETSGNVSFAPRIDGCGTRTERPCIEDVVDIHTISHLCPDNNIPYTADFPVCECCPNPNENTQTTKSCGSIMEPNGC